MKSTTLLIGILALFFLQFNNWSETITIYKYCTIDGIPLDTNTNKTIQLYSPSEEASEILDKIFEVMPSPQKKYLLYRSPDITKAIVTRHNNKTYIIYNHEFINLIKEYERYDEYIGEKAAIYFIFAHEIAHHLHEHTFKDGGSRPHTELQADSTAGRIMNSLGYTEHQTLEVLTHLNKEATNTHPSPMDRKYAIIDGWERGMTSSKIYDVTINARPDDIQFTIQSKKSGKIVKKGYAGPDTISLAKGEYLIKYFNDKKTRFQTLTVPDRTYVSLKL